eukprot:scaffold717_cov101-Isochrysis_galbana.AAC.3
MQAARRWPARRQPERVVCTAPPRAFPGPRSQETTSTRTPETHRLPLESHGRHGVRAPRC